MKLSLNWLKDFVDINVTPDELAKKLTACGFEIEEIIKMGTGMERVVVGKILKITKHPNADKLSVCQVDIGDKIVQILTAATNVFEGALVPVALDGADLPCGISIKTTQMRGLTSDGMFCSGQEIKIDDSVYPGAEIDGIMILQEDYKLGISIAEVIGYDDVVLDVNVLSNRPDCNSIIGLAREVSAILNIPMREPKLDYETKSNENTESLLSVKLEESACTRYMAHCVKNIKREPSPKWMQNRLRAIGIRPIDNIVDITNYVLVECGQPMHAFDYSLLEGQTIIIRTANENEKIVALDGKEYNLDITDTVIADGKKPVAVAGVMGGEYSGINENTKNIVFESATFKRANVRTTSRRLGLRSDSSARYERGVEETSCEYGLRRALALIDLLNAGEICQGEIDNYSTLPQERVIEVRFDKINELLGIDLSIESMQDILNRLFIKTYINGSNLICTIPTFRGDIETLADIAEEIIRIYGFEHVKSTLLKDVSYTASVINPVIENTRKVKTLLKQNSFNEICTYSLIGKDFIAKLQLEEKKLVEIKNPLSEELLVLRINMIHNMLNTISFNYNHNNKNLRLFDIGRTYHYTAEDKLPVEKNVLCIALTGNIYNFFNIKDIVNKVSDLFGCSLEYKATDKFKYMNSYQCGSISYNGEEIGYLGQVHPITTSNYNIQDKVYIVELVIDKLLTLSKVYNKFEPLTKYPTVSRDLTFLVPKEMTYNTFYEELKRSASKQCKSVTLTDVYEGSQVKDGFKSMSFNFLFQKDDATFTDEEIEHIVTKLLKSLQYKLGVTLRDLDKITK